MRHRPSWEGRPYQFTVTIDGKEAEGEIAGFTNRAPNKPEEDWWWGGKFKFEGASGGATLGDSNGELLHGTTVVARQILLHTFGLAYRFHIEANVPCNSTGIVPSAQGSVDKFNNKTNKWENKVGTFKLKKK